MTKRIERKELYDAIWTDPATTVAARYGITSTALAKICRKLNVPAPPRGYWARLAAGQTPTRARLPRLRDDQPTVHVVEWGSARDPTVVPAHVADERARPKVVVPDETVPLHPLLQKYEARLRRRGDDPVKRASVHAIDIDVSRAQLDRAMRVTHAVLCALDERHLPVEVMHADGSSARTTIVTVDGVRLAFGIREERTRILVPVAPPQVQPRVDADAWRSIKDERARAQAYAASLLGRREPPAPASPGPTYVNERWEWSGLLTLWIDPMMQLPGAGPRSFSESATRRIDERLSTFVLRLRSIAVAVHEEQARVAAEVRRRTEEVARREEAERLRVARERAHARDERLRKDLDHRASLFRRAHDIRALLAVMAGDAGTSTSLSSWLEWANGYADALERDAREVPNIWNES